jgi:putative peptidoglycan lipid II flippase
MSILKGTSVVGLFTLTSRVLGFVRDLLIALLFGAGGLSDAYFVAFRIPNLLRSIFAEGALTSAFVPTFAAEGKKGLSHAQSALSSIASALVFTTIIVSLLGIFAAPTVVSIVAPGFDSRPEQYELCVILTRIMMPYICFVSLVALLNGTLNYYLVFGASAFAQVLMNVVLIAAALLALYSSTPRQSTYILAWSVIVGGAIQVVAQLPALKKVGLRFRLSKDVWSPAVKDTLTLMLPAILGSTVYQITIFLNTLFASLLERGSISWLFYADRLTQLPLGIFSLALASVLLPLLSRAQADKDGSTFSKHLINSLRFTSFIIIPTSGALYIFAEPLISLLFERGEFTHQATIRTGEAVKFYSLGLWSVSCYSMLTRAYIAQKDTITPSCGGVLMLILSVIFSILFVGNPESGVETVAYSVVIGMRGFMPAFLLADFGHAGLALSSAISSLVTFCVLLIIFHRRNSLIPWSSFTTATLRTLFATGVALYCASFVSISSLKGLILAVFVYSLVFAFSSFLACSKELHETLMLIFRLLGNFGKKRAH